MSTRRGTRWVVAMGFNGFQLQKRLRLSLISGRVEAPAGDETQLQ